MRYLKTPLFGGAITADIPERFADVSKLRQVPDNQEVWIDKDGFTSIIFDITQRVTKEDLRGSGIDTKGLSALEVDGHALTFHFEDMLGVEKDKDGKKTKASDDDDDNEAEAWNTARTEISKLGPDTPAYTLISTQKHKGGSSERGSRSAADLTVFVMTLIRLEKAETDILVTVVVPHIRGEYDEDEMEAEMAKQGRMVGEAVDYATKIWESFDIKDWGLFEG